VSLRCNASDATTRSSPSGLTWGEWFTVSILLLQDARICPYSGVCPQRHAAVSVALPVPAPGPDIYALSAEANFSYITGLGAKKTTQKVTKWASVYGLIDSIQVEWKNKPLTYEIAIGFGPAGNDFYLVLNKVS
jgi:hypothetical protein